MHEPDVWKTQLVVKITDWILVLLLVSSFLPYKDKIVLTKLIAETLEHVEISMQSLFWNKHFKWADLEKKKIPNNLYRYKTIVCV